MAAGLLSLVFIQPFFCEHARDCTMRYRNILWKGLYVCLSGDPTVCVANSHSLPWVVLKAFGPVLAPRTNDAAHTSLPSPHSLVVNENICVTSPSPREIQRLSIFCIDFFSPSYVAL